MLVLGEQISGVRRSVSLALLPDEAAVGDWVLVHVGFALARIDEDDARRALAWLAGVPADADEPPSFEVSMVGRPD